MDGKKMEALRVLANSLGNVHEACRQMGVSRSQFYKWCKLESEVNGDGKSARRRHPHAIPDGVRERVPKLAVEFPEWGCDRIAHYLGLHGQYASPTTVQKILTEQGLRTRKDRETAAQGRETAAQD
jgi:transposase-like protein